MFDSKIRGVIGPPLELAGGKIAALGVPPAAITAGGWILGVGACVAVSVRVWLLALVLWLGNRLLDGLDGPVARVRGATERGGYLDVVSDFSIYGGFILGLAVAVPQARLACAALLLAYYVSGAALLALSSLLERRHQKSVDERSLRLVGGLAEGFETVIAYVLFCVFPQSTALIAWIFTALVGVTAFQRVFLGARALTIGPTSKADD